MRVKLRMEITGSTDSDQQQQVVDRTAKVDDYTVDVAEGGGPGRVVVPGNTTDMQVAFPAGVTASAIVWIETEGDITIKFNSTGGTPIPVKYNPADSSANPLSSTAKTAQPGLLVFTGVVTAIYLTNPNPDPLTSVGVTISIFGT